MKSWAQSSDLAPASPIPPKRTPIHTKSGLWPLQKVGAHLAPIPISISATRCEAYVYPFDIDAYRRLGYLDILHELYGMHVGLS